MLYEYKIYFDSGILGKKLFIACSPGKYKIAYL